MANQARASIKTNCFFAGLGFVIASASIMVAGTFAEIMAFQGHKSQLLVVICLLTTAENKTRNDGVENWKIRRSQWKNSALKKVSSKKI